MCVYVVMFVIVYIARGRIRTLYGRLRDNVANKGVSRFMIGCVSVRQMGGRVRFPCVYFE